MGNKVFQPSTLKAAIEILNKKTDVEILAGGTDFILELDKIKDANKKIMDISKINELKYIKEDENVLRIGALTTFSELAKSEKIKKYIPALATAGKKVGSVQIRNRATIGGNIANASPAADSMPVLRSLAAKLKISSQKQNRIIPVQDIVKSFYKNNLRENEIIEEIIIPKPEKDDFLFFDKVGSRKTVSIARLNIGAKLKIENDLIKEAVVCFGALSEKAFRAKKVESYLKGRKINNIGTKTYNEKLKNVVDEAIPGRYSQQYKRNAICGLGDNLLNNLRIYAEKGE